MAIEAGQSVSHYRVVEKIGEGGMGVVYRADDTKLGRSVALKVLPDRLVTDESRLARFAREAQLLASLNHPNIASIYGLEEAGDVTALVLELVEGETLEERIARGTMPVQEAVRVALEIAEALEAAHERGIVHRDLKPGNVKFGADGRVKVLDFGLAKALETGSGGEDATKSPTLTLQHATEAGMILGTAAYMSPEQAAGETADARSDVWAFGVVLYEMLAGRRPFGGESISYVLAAVLRDEPDLAALPDHTPPVLRRLIERCLTKDRRQRLQAIGEARIVLSDPRALEAGSAADRSDAAPGGRPWLAWGTAALLLVALLAVLFGPWRGAPATAERPPRWLELPDLAPDAVRFETAISRDGTRLASVQQGAGDTTALFVYFLETGESRQVALETAWPSGLFFSPDGAWLGYLVEDGIRRVHLDGGQPETVHSAFLPRSATWLDDGTIVFSRWDSKVLYRVPASGGASEQLTELDAERGDLAHQVLGRGRAAGQILLRVDRGRRVEDRMTLETLDVTTGARATLRGDLPATMEVAVASGELLWIEQGVLQRTPIDGGGARGPATTVAEGVTEFEVADDGTLVLGRESARALYRMTWADPDGTVRPAESLPFLSYPTFSPDGRYLAGHRNDQAQVHDLARGVTTPLLPDPYADLLLAWSGDGRRLLFTSNREGPFQVYRVAADGSGEPVRLTDDEGSIPYVSAVNDDGSSFAYCRNGDVLRATEGEPARRMEVFPSGVCGGPLPGGRFVLYASEETGRSELFVRAMEGPGRWQLTTTGAEHPLVSLDGREIYYMLPGKLMRIRLDTKDGTIVPGPPEVRLAGRFPPLGIDRYYAVSPDGRVLLPMLDPELAERQPRLQIVLGWGG